MLGRYKKQHDVVADWFGRAGEGLANDELVDLLEEALRVVRSAARPDVSEVMLAAVLDRVLVNTADAYPSLPRATSEAGVASFASLRTAAPRLERTILRQAIVFLLTDFRAILANLTIETLSKGLQSKLAAVRLKRKRHHPGERGL